MRSTRRMLLLAAFGAALVTPAMAQPSGQAAPDRQQRLTSAESYLPIPTLSAGVIQRQALSRGTLVVDLGLDVPDEALRNRARANGPRLRDAMRTALSTYASTYYRDRTAPDPTQMTRLLQMSVDRTLGAPGARVLLTNIIVQQGGGR